MDRRTDEQAVVHPHNRTVSNLQQKRHPDTSYNMADPEDMLSDVSHPQRTNG